MKVNFNFYNLKLLGFLYLMISFLGGLLGFAFSIVLSVELNNPFPILKDYYYYVCLTSHGLIMLFLFTVLVSTGFYNYFLQNLGGLSSLGFVGKLGFWGFVLMAGSIIMIIFSLFMGEGCNVGWTMYPPLSESSYNGYMSLDILILGMNIFLISSFISALNIMIMWMTSLNNFESYLGVPVLSWGFFLTGVLTMMGIPAVFCVLTMLLLDSNLGTFYFNCEKGGSPILFQSMFWIFGHAEVYVFILPVFGLMSQVLKTICKGYLYNKSGIIFSMMSLSILSMLVFGHHMTTVGWGLNVKVFFMIVTLIISLPTGVKVFSWLYTLVFYGKKFNIVSGYVSLFIIIFAFGGMTGVILANYSLDVMLHDSYFMLGHFHLVANALMFGVLSGLILYFKSMFNLELKLNNYMVIIKLFFFTGISLMMLQLFLTFHILGLIGVSSSMFNYSVENFLLFHLGSVSFMGIWVSLSFMMLILLLTLNINNEK